MSKKIYFWTFTLSAVIFSSADAQNNGKWEYKQYSGKIDNKFKINMTIISADNPDLIKGYYAYNDSRNNLKLVGFKEGEALTVNEFDANEKQTGTFKGQFVGDSFKGDWLKVNSEKKLPFFVTRNYNNKTLVKDIKTKKSLIGTNNCSLQWISWDKLGNLKVEEKDNKLIVNGSQKISGDSLEIDGYFTMIDKNRLDFNGKITTQVSHINNGSPCFREGDMTFLKYDNRSFWRLQEMSSPCDEVTDYVDVSIRKK